MQPFVESLKIEDNILPMEVDAGASITIVGEQTFKTILPIVFNKTESFETENCYR